VDTIDKAEVQTCCECRLATAMLHLADFLRDPEDEENLANQFEVYDALYG
jgi:hypothetical protein